MGFFGFGKKDKVLDLTEGYKMRVAAAEKAKKTQSAADSSPFAFFDSPGATGSGSDSDTIDLSDTADERKKKLAKRIADMTEKVEDLNNQIYHLQQRLEVLERKNDIRRFDSS